MIARIAAGRYLELIDLDLPEQRFVFYAMAARPHAYWSFEAEGKTAMRNHRVRIPKTTKIPPPPGPEAGFDEIVTRRAKGSEGREVTHGHRDRPLGCGTLGARERRGPSA